MKLKLWLCVLLIGMISSIGYSTNTQSRKSKADSVFVVKQLNDVTTISTVENCNNVFIFQAYEQERVNTKVEFNKPQRSVEFLTNYSFVKKTFPCRLPRDGIRNC
jgi:hypothetical protein